MVSLHCALHASLLFLFIPRSCAFTHYSQQPSRAWFTPLPLISWIHFIVLSIILYLRHIGGRNTPSWIAASLPPILPSNPETTICMHYECYFRGNITQYLPCTVFRFPVFPFCQFPFITIITLFTPYAHVPNPVNHNITYATKNGISTNRYHGHHD